MSIQPGRSGWTGGTSGQGFTPSYDRNAPEPEPKFSIEALRGFRMWNAEDDGKLRSISFAYHWTAAWNTAQCLRSLRYFNPTECAAQYHPDKPYMHTEECPVQPGCEYPRVKCGCGFYGYFDREYWTRPITGTIVTGIIEGIGRCVIGPKGFRAEKARILGLHTGDENADAVHQRYSRLGGIPIYENEDDLLNAYPLTGPPA